MALTATATDRVRADILSSLRMRTPTTFTISFFRKNLTFRVIPKDYSIDQETKRPVWENTMLQFIADRPRQTGIVYCLSRDDAENTALRIREIAGVPAMHYHAGMTPLQRTKVQNSWRIGETRVVAATIAFGMGIDHATVRYVLHATMSKSLEGYYQEAGRAGRDGLPAECILYHGPRDALRITNLLRRGKGRGRSGKSSSSFQKGVAQLNSMTAYCTEIDTCRHAQLLDYFGERWRAGSCSSLCDVCRGEVVKLSGTSQKKGGQKRKGETNDSGKAAERGSGRSAAASKPALAVFSTARNALRDYQPPATAAAPVVTTQKRQTNALLQCFKPVPREK